LYTVIVHLSLKTGVLILLFDVVVGQRRTHPGTDVFVFHGYTELYLGGRWVKATPAFNRSLCERARILPLEFNGVDDSIYHPFDADGRRHIKYLRYRGEYVDIPVEEMMAAVVETYGEKGRQWLNGSVGATRFEDEVGSAPR
jgi:hypothetical protein